MYSLYSTLSSLVLKFWANLLKYPECLLDVAMGETQESALTVIAQVNSHLIVQYNTILS